jgi:hypothetical protein
MPAAGGFGPVAVRRIRELAVATASHKVLPMCCSSFFRPEEAFAALKAWVMEDLLDRALGEHPVRIWIPARHAKASAIWIRPEQVDGRRVAPVSCARCCGRKDS